MNISKLLKRLFMSFMLYADGDDGAGGADLAEMFEARDGGGDDGASDPAGGDGTGDADPDLQIDPENPDEEPDLDEEDEPVFEIPVGDGKTIKKTQSELLAEASKYHGANAKFEEAAAIRKDAEAKLAKVPEREQQLGMVLDHYIRQSQALMAEQQPNWDALLAQDAGLYTRVRHQWEQRQSQLHQAMQAKQTLDQRNAEAAAVSLQERLTAEKAKIIEAIPEWKDPVKAKAGAAEIGSYLTSQGIPAEMQEQMDTAEVFVIARKAMLYDKAIARQKATREGVKPAPLVARPGASQPTPKRQMARAKAQKAFDANPTAETAAYLFE